MSLVSDWLSNHCPIHFVASRRQQQILFTFVVSSQPMLCCMLFISTVLSFVGLVFPSGVHFMVVLVMLLGSLEHMTNPAQHLVHCNKRIYLIYFYCQFSGTHSLRNTDITLCYFKHTSLIFLCFCTNPAYVLSL